MSEKIAYFGAPTESEKEFILMAGIMGIEKCPYETSEMAAWVYGVDQHLRKNPESWDMIHLYFLAISYYWPYMYKNARERVRKWRKKNEDHAHASA